MWQAASNELDNLSQLQSQELTFAEFHIDEAPPVPLRGGGRFKFKTLYYV